MKLTEAQEQVVYTRNKNMLVSAAAGSGKTAVLVQRIISKIIDEKNPVDVDRILVVTFTNAAAAEMKERVRLAIEKEVREHPERIELRSQATLVHNAQIRTIDSFCNWVVKNYFYEIDQDPSFRVGSAGELKMLRNDVLDQLLAKRFEARQADFISLADAYIEGKNIDSLKEKIYELHEKAMSFPWPDEWYDGALKLYNIDSLEALSKHTLILDLVKNTKEYAANWATNLQLACNMYADDYSGKDLEILKAEQAMYKALSEAKTYEQMRTIFAGASFARLTIKGLDPDTKELAQTYRNNAKTAFGKLKDKSFVDSLEDMYEDLMYVKGHATTLVSLAKEFTSSFLKLKKKKNVFDFSDIEHMALEILREADSTEHNKRPVAIELSNMFEEVMVDEYQDSNDLQEWILTSVCKKDNYFTVGDVKQSIYSFRQASPSLFMEKFDSYVAGRPDSVRIDLDMNFRSRSQVLNFCNDVFSPLMQKDMGNVAYDEAASLKVGASYYPENECNLEPEILVASFDKEEALELGVENANALEAQMVAKRIKQLVQDNFLVTADDPADKDHKILRPVKYNDIVILLRSTKTSAPIFLKALNNNGIPAYVEEETGFFDRDEIRTLLCMLEVVDNPYNDIPLTAVLHSPMFGIDSDALARIRCFSPDVSFYECIFDYAANYPKDGKIGFFVELLHELRNDMLDTPIHEMIKTIVDRTGYGTYISALPLGDNACANLNKLIDEAISFEGTSYQGLSRFVNHINDMKTYDEDLGLAKTVSENDVAVRIMTIHKSKGLEFPIVFLSRAGGKVSGMPKGLLYHPSLGIGMDYKNPDTRVSRRTFFSNAIRSMIDADDKGEELRILYVALTRAKEKLFITGSMKTSKDKTVAELIADYKKSYDYLPYEVKLSSSSYMEWILRALYARDSKTNLRIYSAGDLLVDEVLEAAKAKLTKQALGAYIDSIDISLGNTIADSLTFTYDKGEDLGYKSKYSVSEIKHQAMEENLGLGNESKAIFSNDDADSFIPDFAKDIQQDNDSEQSKGVPAGALYGTAMHRAMECFDFEREDYIDSIDMQLNQMRALGLMAEDDTKRLNHKQIKNFINSDTAKRMHDAAKLGRLYKEQPFVFGGTPDMIFGQGKPLGQSADIKIDDMILVQGIIDVFFEEEDGIVLLDYKTDRVDSARDLVLRYEKQLDLYKDAISRAYDTNVKEILIYSFCLGCAINI